MGRDEQKEEREVLDSIFPEEITGSSSQLSPMQNPAYFADFAADISETEYRISILLDVTNAEGDDSEPRT